MAENIFQQTSYGVLRNLPNSVLTYYGWKYCYVALTERASSSDNRRGESFYDAWNLATKRKLCHGQREKALMRMLSIEPRQTLQQTTTSSQ